MASHCFNLFLGAKLVYLPPYSPDLDPAEQGFHFIKAWLKRHQDEAFDTARRPWLIFEASAAVTPELALAWIGNCGYS